MTIGIKTPQIDDIVAAQIGKIEDICKEKKPLVAIHCLAYNHEPYIRDAIEGFLMQKTTFPFVVIVHEDDSTDGTREILREYSKKYQDIIIPIFEIENQYSKGGFSLISTVMNKAIDATGAKYIAMCEGDDYWTDPLKLQKQVNFLETHPAYGMCYTKVKYYNHNKKKFMYVWGGPSEKFEEFLLNNTIPTLTVLLKKNVYDKYTFEINPSSHKDWLMGDYPLWLYFAKNSKIHFLDDVTGVYRVLQNSASHNPTIDKQLSFIKSARSIALDFSNIYNIKTPKFLLKEIAWLNLLLKIVTNEAYKSEAFKLLYKVKGHRLLFCIFSITLPRKINYLIISKKVK